MNNQIKRILHTSRLILKSLRLEAHKKRILRKFKKHRYAPNTAEAVKLLKKIDDMIQSWQMLELEDLLTRWGRQKREHEDYCWMLSLYGREKDS